MRNLIFIFFFLFSVTANSVAQSSTFNSGWHIGANIGLTSFFGDLSVHDFDPVQKLTQESKVCFGLLVSKDISRTFDAQIQYEQGGMKGSNPDIDLYFTNRFSEFSLMPGFNLTQLIWPENTFSFSLKAQAGIGVINYRSIKYSISDDDYISSEGYDARGNKQGNARTSVVYPVGFLMQYALSDRWSLDLGFALRLHNTDEIDAHPGSTSINDRYSVVSLGVRFALSKMKNERLRRLPCPEGDDPSRKRKAGNRLF